MEVMENSDARKTILCIDLSTVMCASSGLYEHLIYNTELSSDEIWGRLDKTPIIKQSISFDRIKFLNILELVAVNKDKNVPIIFTETQKEIVDKFPEEKCNIVNIDHCHDIFYDKHDIDKMHYVQDYDENNWIGYLFDCEKIYKYHWLSNVNSYRPTDSAKDFFPFIYSENYKELLWSDIDNIINTSFDIVFVSLSPRWVPYRYYFLYDILKIVGGVRDYAKY